MNILFLAMSLWSSSAWAGSVKASSEAKDSAGQKHTAELAVDGLLSTGWAEGVAGLGDGEWIEVKLDAPIEVRSVSIWPGNLSNGQRSIKEYGHPKRLTVRLITAAGPVDQSVRIVDDHGEPQRVDVTIDGMATAVRIILDEGFEGPVFEDTTISEMAINFTMGDRPAAVEKAQTWQGTAAAESAFEKNKQTIDGWKAAIEAAEFGDQALLEQIMAQAADGSPPARERAKSVPFGFRITAIPPDPAAIEVLLALKDPNAIPALEMAALRTTGKQERDLKDRAEYFYAYREWVGGPNRNVPAWGEPGWWPGALKSLGEPLPLAVDPFGDVYVAETGNHRIQRFSADGRSNRIWGADWGEEPGIINVGVEGRQPYYVAGAAPSTKKGQFRLPLDLVLLPGKQNSGFAILDGSGRVQIFGEDGERKFSFTIDIGEIALEAGVGGQAFLERVGNRWFVAWDRQAFLIDDQGKEIKRWRIEDGVPRGSVALPNGKLGLIFDDQLILFSADGFRHGKLLSDDARDAGFESWDVTVDEDGKLWAITDTGIVVKYKKPGKVDFAVKISEKELDHPRMAVFDDIVFFTSGDRIHRVDALELHAKAMVAAGKKVKKK